MAVFRGNHLPGKILLGLCLMGVLGVSTSVMLTNRSPFQPEQPLPGNVPSGEETHFSDLLVLELVEFPSAARRARLTAIASSNKKSLDRHRARYLLGMDYLIAEDGAAAVDVFNGLERDYPVLAPHILIKRGRAYELTGDLEKAKSLWLRVVRNYRDDPAVAEALFRLDAYDSTYGDQAIAEYPAHPRTQSLIRARLDSNPKQLDLLVLLLEYASEGSNISQVHQTLIDNFSSQLSPDLWEAIADGYWQQGQYPEAADAYQKAPETSQNLYRQARGVHLDEQEKLARTRYQTLINTFPDAPETALGLRHLASLSGSTDEAIAHLDQAIQQFPEDAPITLARKAALLVEVGDATAADDVSRLLLQKYPQHEAASDFRWEQAGDHAKAGNYEQAINWANQMITETPKHSSAPEALFWVGKWSVQLGKTSEAQQAYNQVLADYPESYYAWRSAVQLGWDVASFNSVRSLQPPLSISKIRPAPATGSETFQELYRLGQDFDAWNGFRLEQQQKALLSVPEAFTEALLKLAAGQYLQGINGIWELSRRDDPGDRQDWLTLRESDEYWHALFPFPYDEPIIRWAQARELNPLLVVSLMRQESRFERQIESPVGAKGLMQIMPDTAEWIAELTDGEPYDLDNPEDNIRLGTWYMRYTHQEYDDNSMLAIASYNAGPSNVAEWVERYNLNDPDIFVEQIPFNETQNYIKTVFGNYWNYERLYNPTLQETLDAHQQAIQAKTQP